MFSTFRWVFKYCYWDRPQWGITYSGAFLRSFLVFSVHFLQPYHIASLILICPLGFRTSYGSRFPSSSFSLASPFVPVGDFVTFVSFFPFFYYFDTSVFFPRFCTGLLLRGCYIWGLLQGENWRYALYDLLILKRHRSYATVWYWFQDDRHCGLALSPSPFPVTVSLWLGA